MIFVKDTLCFIIFYSIISYLSFGDVNGKHIPKNNAMVDYPAEENQIPLYRDAQYYEPASELQLIKHLIPIGYSTHLVTPRESVSTPNYFGSSVPYPRQLPLQSAAIGSSDFNKLGVLLKAMEIAADESPNSPAPSMNIRQKVETVARLLILAPSFADEIFKCLSQSEAANKFIQTAQNFSNRSEEPTTTS